jgi:hypothetical protein
MGCHIYVTKKVVGVFVSFSCAASSYTTTDIHQICGGELIALTNATRDGQWVITWSWLVPSEIQAALVKLLEDRLVPLGNGEV